MNPFCNYTKCEHTHHDCKVVGCHYLGPVFESVSCCRDGCPHLPQSADRLKLEWVERHGQALTNAFGPNNNAPWLVTEKSPNRNLDKLKFVLRSAKDMFVSQMNGNFIGFYIYAGGSKFSGSRFKQIITILRSWCFPTTVIRTKGPCHTPRGGSYRRFVYHDGDRWSRPKRFPKCKVCGYPK